MKTAELIGKSLDWAVAKCEEYPMGIWYDEEEMPMVRDDEVPEWKPSTDWAQGGPIIEREGIAVVAESPEMWCAWRSLEGYMSEENSVYGDTPLIAAMRCYVVSKLGDDIEIPNELMEAA